MATSNRDVALFLARVADRDRVAFRRLYRATSGKLFGVTLTILRNRAEAEEALQETYIKVWNNAGRYVPGDFSPITWLVAIARNQAIDTIRRRGPPSGDLHDASEVADAGRDPEQSLLRSEMRAVTERLLAQLDEKKASAVRGIYLDGETYGEFAARCAVPLNTVRTRLKRGLQELRQLALQG